MQIKLIKLFLRLSIAAGFLSAVADRFGMWPAKYSAWGTWDAFLNYTATLNPWFPESWIPAAAVAATAAEVLFALFLIIGYKTKLFANLSGLLLLVFAISMAYSTGIKRVFDASVLAASAAAFALGTIKTKFLEVK